MYLILGSFDFSAETFNVMINSLGIFLQLVDRFLDHLLLHIFQFLMRLLEQLHLSLILQRQSRNRFGQRSGSWTQLVTCS